MWDIIIIGAGAAGLLCAAEAAKGKKSVLVLEHNQEVGKKILISGGGRCNFTNLFVEPENYISKNPHFCKSALARYTPWDFIALVEKYGIAYHEKKLGQLFCDGSAQAIVDLLLSECRKYQVRIQTAKTIQRVEKNQSFAIHTAQEVYHGHSLVLATGGLSIPKIGATDLGYRILKQFGHPLVEMRPGLVPLKLNQSQASLNALRGISLDVRVSTSAMQFRENLLFTHFGLSGPAILQISNYWQGGESLALQVLPELSWETILTDPQVANLHLHNLLGKYLPQRLANYWFEKYAKPVKQLNSTERAEILTQLNQRLIHPTGSMGYAKAEVTLGGADTQFFSSKTMASTRIPGLYCIGELLDVTGWLGGYNFQWAWASGVAAGQALAKA